MKYLDKEVLGVEKGSITTVDWTLGNYCNYKCSYCFHESNSGNCIVPKLDDTIKENITHLAKQIKKLDKDEIVWKFSGGEPTLYSDYENIVKHVSNYGHVAVVSNGSRTLRWWKEFGHMHNRVELSFHTESANLDHFKNVIQTLIDHNVFVQVYVMINPKKFNYAKQALINFLETFKNNIHYKIGYLRDIENKYYCYTPEQYSMLNNIQGLINELDYTKKKSSTNIPYQSHLLLHDGSKIKMIPSVVSKLDGNWKTFKCYAHQDFLQIDRRGQIGMMSCGGQYSELFTIYDKEFLNFKISRSPLNCSTQNGRCGCLGLQYSRKMKVG